MKGIWFETRNKEGALVHDGLKQSKKPTTRQKKSSQCLGSDVQRFTNPGANEKLDRKMHLGPVRGDEGELKKVRETRAQRERGSIDGVNHCKGQGLSYSQGSNYWNLEEDGSGKRSTPSTKAMLDTPKQLNEQSKLKNLAQKNMGMQSRRILKKKRKLLGD